jgi:glycosyl transferase family 25
MRTLVINLERDAVRLAAMKAEFARHDVPFERFAAVDGLVMPAALRGYFFGADGRPAPTLTKGEIGCYASHLSLWRRIASGQYSDVTLICEDDIRLPDNFQAVLDAALGAAPPDWDVIRLSAEQRVGPFADPRRTARPLLKIRRCWGVSDIAARRRSS